MIARLTTILAGAVLWGASPAAATVAFAPGDPCNVSMKSRLGEKRTAQRDTAPLAA